MIESDGIDEALGRSLREALALAEQNGRRLSDLIARAREILRLREEAAARRAEAQARYEAAWKAARDKLAVADDDQWWDKATPAQIAEVYEVAVTWREHETEAARIDEVIYEQVLDRYDHDLRTPSPEQVRHDLEEIRARHEEITEERDHDAPEPEHVEEPEREEPRYDSEERRELTREEMLREGLEPEVVETRMRVDTMNARPPRDAVERKHAATRLAGPRGRGTARTRKAQQSLE
ncbi:MULTISPECIES: hypothetical protein [unclassified Nocardiopsis]|uniref:hypothetical protein n=1 Tax=unclassified Nocardiopsis TaxID=2649073 RepID=UPI00135C396C|nr:MULTISPECIES: hypothetical protein [unclassified Nocardiopsis]